MACARTVAGRGGRMVLVAPRPDVLNVLTTSGIDEIIPVHPDLASAAAALTA